MFKFIKKCEVFFIGVSCLLLTAYSNLSAAEGNKKLPVDLKDLNAQQASSKSKNSNQQIRNSWKPYFLRNSSFESIQPFFTNLNVGIGFLYFDQVRGATAPINRTSELKTTQMQTRFVYNKTPLVELNVGYNLGAKCKKFSFLGLGIGVLNQSNVNIQSYNITRTLNTNPRPKIFSAMVNLNAIVAKLNFYLPYSMIWKKLAYSPYMNVAVGPSWQTWSQLRLYQQNVPDMRVYRQKISANCFFGAEGGLKLRSLMPSVNLCVTLGCKFNLWGQARSMGKINQQYRNPEGNLQTAGVEYALEEPYKVKTVYQWAPYLGILWAY